MSYHRFKFEKLVRDHVVAQCIEEGCRPATRTLEGAELKQALLDKLVEEAGEVRSAQGNRLEIIKELADLKDVMLTLMRQYGISADEVEAARKAKLARKGGFRTGTYIIHNDLPEGHHEVDDFMAQPEKYPYLGRVE